MVYELKGRRRISDDALLDFLNTYTVSHGYPPSIREIMDGVGFHSTSAVCYRLRSLVKEGLMRPRAKGSQRTYTTVAV
jgi:SOS-response transcriptional repressor LexA